MTPAAPSSAEEIAQRVIEGEMKAENIVYVNPDGILLANVSGREVMVEVRVFDVSDDG